VAEFRVSLLRESRRLHEAVPALEREARRLESQAAVSPSSSARAVFPSAGAVAFIFAVHPFRAL
jgi:hypothetical protein